MIRILHGDMRVELPKLSADSIDSCVTDPPYEIGFMGKRWDNTGIAYKITTWNEVLAVLKPGAYLLAFGGTRTFHRMVSAIEDAGFEIRDSIAWLYGSGFPKSHNLDGDQKGWGTALKPAMELICVARKPLSERTVAANVLRHGTGAINVDACRVQANTAEMEGRSGATVKPNSVYGVGMGYRPKGIWKPDTLGRWPANVCHDGSEEVVAGFPNSDGQQGRVKGNEPSECFNQVYSGPKSRQAFEPRGDEGSAARFFYTAKADSADRQGSKHPTVKPTDLMRWLVKLVTPPGGTVLDPFCGTGSTLLAADQLQFNAIGIEQDATYAADARRKFERDAGLFAEIAP